MNGLNQIEHADSNLLDWLLPHQEKRLADTVFAMRERILAMPGGREKIDAVIERIRAEKNT